ncbi:MAG TPA: hypothetical protein VGP93_10270, partial [Polyangiaceae bacterium]|nr:hypothetical protein [Polyangiaceae bacterium]
MMEISMRLGFGFFALLLLGCGASPNGAKPNGDAAGATSGGTASNGGSHASAGGASPAGGSGGSAVAGAANAAGGSAGQSGAAGSGGKGGTTGSGTLATCDNPAGPGLPDTAPTLEQGTWKDISPSQVPFGIANTQGMAIDPCNPATLYLCVAANDMTAATPGVYKSTDAGTTWNKVGHLDTPLHVRVDPKDSEHLY